MEFLAAGFVDFILSHFDTITEIKVLQLFYKNNYVHISLNGVAVLLAINTELADHILQHLQNDGFVKSAGGLYWFNDSNPKPEFIKKLVFLYENERKVLEDFFTCSESN